MQGTTQGCTCLISTLAIVGMLTAKTGPYTGSYSGLYVLHPVLTVVGTALPKQDLIQGSTQAVHT